MNKNVIVKAYKNKKPVTFSAKVLSINESEKTFHGLDKNGNLIKNIPFKNVVNEGIFDKVKDKIKSFWKLVKGFITFQFKDGKDVEAAVPVNSVIAQNKGQLPNAVIVIPSEDDIRLAKEAGIEIDRDDAISMLEDKYSSETNESNKSKWRKYRRLNEAKIELKHFDNDVLNVNEEELKRFISRSIKHPATSTPLLIWGAPGIGKTQIVNQVLKRVTDNKGQIKDITVSRIQPDEFFLPAVDRDKALAYDIAKDWLPVYKPTGDPEKDKIADNIANGGTVDTEGHGGVLFFDEITRANMSTQNICLTLIQERGMSGYKLGSKWAIIAASNRPDDDPDSSLEIGTALKNRFQHINFVPTIESWSSWARDNIEYTEIVDFLNVMKEYFYNLDNEGGKAIFATPRSWENASKSLADEENDAAEEGRKLTMADKEHVIAANVGKTAAAMFMAYYQLAKTFPAKDIERVWHDAASFKTLPFKVVSPQVEAVLTAIVNYMDGKKITSDEYANFATFLTKLNNPSYATFGMKLLEIKHPYISLHLYDTYKEGSDILDKKYPMQ